MKNFLALIKPLGFILMVLSGAILFSFLISLFQTLPSVLEIKAFSVAIFSSLFIGLVLFFFPNYQKRISFFDGCILVALGWLLCAFFGSLPYFIALPVDFIDAFFESTSGFTTTGATIFKDIESLPPSILLWRSTTQWVEVWEL